MSVLDIIIIIFLGLFFLSSLFKGVVREIFSLMGYLVGYISAINYSDEVTLMTQNMLPQEIMARIHGVSIISIIFKILAALIIFFTIKALFILLGHLVRKFIDVSPVLSMPDRFLGGVLGLLKGLVFVGIIMFPLSLFENAYKRITTGSIMIPYFEKIVLTVKQGSYGNSLINKIPKTTIDEFKNRVKEMGDVEKLTEIMNSKKDDLFKSVQDLVIKEPSQEDYTDKDKNELNNLIDNLSKQ